MVFCESHESYIWVLEQFLECMQGKALQFVITDGDPAMQIAIQFVFPDAHHRLCAWHLLRNATSNICDPSFTQLFKHCMLVDMETDEFEAHWENMINECDVSNVDWVKDLYSKKYAWRCVDFLRDNEDELEFCSWYGTSVLQTEFVKLEKSAWTKFTREMFARFRESLKRCVCVRICEINDTVHPHVYTIQKYRRPEMTWQVYREPTSNIFSYTCM
ncbi:protein FAR1-RELATED SEQUENCE 5-like [Arachis hypogaea]|uniref:protein FAR1-RELATED SEQUENCE 5-like n=1 Tax=Arachis hypogaea TaxID=3818 RepID=UPI003B217978